MLLWAHSSFFFFKQKTAYEMRISDWSSDVCSSDLSRVRPLCGPFTLPCRHSRLWTASPGQRFSDIPDRHGPVHASDRHVGGGKPNGRSRSEEHTSELQSLMRISYAVFCLKQKNRTKNYA